MKKPKRGTWSTKKEFNVPYSVEGFRELTQELEELQKQYQVYGKIFIEFDCDSEYSPMITFYYHRPETDEEYKKRVKRDRRQRKEQKLSREKRKEREYQTYLKLEKKYGRT